MQYRSPLDQILKEEGRSQTWLAAKVGKRVAQINDYVSGKRSPKDVTKVAIAKVLDRSVGEIFFDEHVRCHTDSGRKEAL